MASATRCDTPLTMSATVASTRRPLKTVLPPASVRAVASAAARCAHSLSASANSRRSLTSAATPKGASQANMSASVLACTANSRSHSCSCPSTCSRNALRRDASAASNATCSATCRCPASASARALSADTRPSQPLSRCSWTLMMSWSIRSRRCSCATRAGRVAHAPRSNTVASSSNSTTSRRTPSRSAVAGSAVSGTVSSRRSRSSSTLNDTVQTFILASAARNSSRNFARSDSASSAAGERCAITPPDSVCSAARRRSGVSAGAACAMCPYTASAATSAWCRSQCVYRISSATGACSTSSLRSTSSAAPTLGGVGELACRRPASSSWCCTASSRRRLTRPALDTASRIALRVSAA
eukprot:Unigene10173_Nuclearia_a/m.31082 Unigene10173_Nuclearia_a/g.31082  ORF Unigene10173_Nuclearia_a/g.31082 Unigene10173_Nuclearia_a/m.31082 type:complete len:357 (-) Unigene10173_Nuclearia_a:923-1993(-)